MQKRLSFVCPATATPIVLAFGMITVLFPVAVAAQTTCYVDADQCPGPGTGTEADPFCEIQDAIVASANGDEIIVAPGTYNELIDFLGKGVTLRSSGGRDVTIIDAGPVPDPGTGKPVVRCDSGEGPDTVLDGFTVTGGTGDVGGFGGGMFIDSSSPTVTNSRFAANIASGGGGMSISSGSPTVTELHFRCKHWNKRRRVV